MFSRFVQSLHLEQKQSLLFSLLILSVTVGLANFCNAYAQIGVIILMMFNVFNTAYNEYWGPRRAKDEVLRLRVRFPFLPKKWSARFQYATSILAIVAMTHNIYCLRGSS